MSGRLLHSKHWKCICLYIKKGEEKQHPFMGMEAGRPWHSDPSSYRFDTEASSVHSEHGSDGHEVTFLCVWFCCCCCYAGNLRPSMKGCPQAEDTSHGKEKKGWWQDRNSLSTKRMPICARWCFPLSRRVLPMVEAGFETDWWCFSWIHLPRREVMWHA